MSGLDDRWRSNDGETATGGEPELKAEVSSGFDAGTGGSLEGGENACSDGVLSHLIVLKSLTFQLQCFT
jgi:hypothetical protein